MQLQLRKLEQQLQPSLLTRVTDPFLDQHQIELWLKRDDLLHPIISGNKWRKLKYILQHALSTGADTIISMGGAYSNHLHALAYVGKLLNISTVAYIRGEQPKLFNPTLKDLAAWGMQLKFISRSSYRELRHFQSLPEQAPNEYWLPEGGALGYALQGVAEMLEEIDIAYDTICVPCGTGTTLAGMIASAHNQTAVLGFAALKGTHFLEHDVNKLLPESSTGFCPWSINHDYHFGGFAETILTLLEFIDGFEDLTGIELEPVYSGKMMYGIYGLIEQGYFAKGHRIIAVHTGGLQGKRGFTDA
jgi:1-aminocyclopropane-1-carboxylate deaminase